MTTGFDLETDSVFRFEIFPTGPGELCTIGGRVAISRGRE
jgi:hypothetical protein